MASKNTSNQTCENENDNQWPRFLIMEAADEKVPLNLNAFVLKKAIDGMANAELDNVKPMKSGRVFIEVETRQQCKNLLKTTKLLGYLPVKVSPHRTLNSSKFVIKCEELDKMEEDEIKKELQPQGIIAVKRISIRYSLYVLTIKGQTIPKRINIGYLKKETRPYVPNPQRCFQCQKFGHTKNSCKPSKHACTVSVLVKYRRYWQYRQQYCRYRMGTDPEVFCQYRNGTVLPVQFLFWFFTESLIPISGTLSVPKCYWQRIVIFLFLICNFIWQYNKKNYIMYIKQFVVGYSENVTIWFTTFRQVL